MPVNYVDYGIIAIVAISVIFGLYRGFLASLLDAGGGIVAFLGSFWLYPKIEAWIKGNKAIINSLLSYTDALTRVGDQTLAATTVNNLPPETIKDIISRVKLPAPLSGILQSNLENNVFSASGLNTVSDYVSQTVLSVSIKVISFIAAFILLYLFLSIAVNVIRIVFKLPVLKQMDTLAGGLFGFLRAMLICYVLLALVPLVETVIPLKQVNELIQTSTFARYFNNGNLIMSIVEGKFF